MSRALTHRDPLDVQPVAVPAASTLCTTRSSALHVRSHTSRHRRAHRLGSTGARAKRRGRRSLRPPGEPGHLAARAKCRCCSTRPEPPDFDGRSATRASRASTAARACASVISCKLPASHLLQRRTSRPPLRDNSRSAGSCKGILLRDSVGHAPVPMVRGRPAATLPEGSLAARLSEDDRAGPGATRARSGQAARLQEAGFCRDHHGPGAGPGRRTDRQPVRERATRDPRRRCSRTSPRPRRWRRGYETLEVS